MKPNIPPPPRKPGPKKIKGCPCLYRLKVPIKRFLEAEKARSGKTETQIVEESIERRMSEFQRGIFYPWPSGNPKRHKTKNAKAKI
jgi:hypothetical protein